VKEKMETIEANKKDTDPIMFQSISYVAGPILADFIASEIECGQYLFEKGKM
jgi:hypothetical protein